MCWVLTSGAFSRCVQVCDSTTVSCRLAHPPIPISPSVILCPKLSCCVSCWTVHSWPVSALVLLGFDCAHTWNFSSYTVHVAVNFVTVSRCLAEQFPCVRKCQVVLRDSSAGFWLLVFFLRECFYLVKLPLGKSSVVTAWFFQWEVFTQCQSSR